ncbi:MAG: SRPBCC domain-containing protein [Candidatus Binatus sp.]|uniref:SRPBCC family protein n=2 Tax=Candidatus Binatus sp. TaxID=2811406 RepID=UPI003BAFC796
MAASTTEAGVSTDRVLVVERIFDAPRSLVFRAWIEPQHLLRWFGPRGYTVPSYTLDPRPGGGWRCCMVSPAGVENWVRGVFREVLEPERLAFTWAHENADGTIGHETLITVTLADLGDKTELTLCQETFESIEARNDHRNGWSSAIECLAEYLATLN